MTGSQEDFWRRRRLIQDLISQHSDLKDYFIYINEARELFVVSFQAFDHFRMTWLTKRLENRDPFELMKQVVEELKKLGYEFDDEE